MNPHSTADHHNERLVSVLWTWWYQETVEPTDPEQDDPQGAAMNDIRSLLDLLAREGFVITESGSPAPTGVGVARHLPPQRKEPPPPRGRRGLCADRKRTVRC